ncbi:ComEA family DNA-binding protein [Mailhella sp.]|uniref:ComEA family DNA-binding protein n=1 Tax=Mailhella sp. TaxID=1981029 RepID=UPI0040638CD5
MGLKNILFSAAIALVLAFSGNAMAAEKLNLNMATQAELAADPNIGPELAAKIVEFRENVGDFTKYEDLKEIEGINDAKIKQINEKFQIEGVASFDCNC